MTVFLNNVVSTYGALTYVKHTSFSLETKYFQVVHILPVNVLRRFL